MLSETEQKIKIAGGVGNALRLNKQVVSHCPDYY